jgi:glycosyltransferase involved in cell wall biosynthesis
MKILFVSNLYPSAREPNRGLPNARLLRHLSQEHDIRLLVARPKLLPPHADGVNQQGDTPLAEDLPLAPRIAHVPYAPKLGSLLNRRLYARGIRAAFAKTLAEGRPDAVLVAWLFPDLCGVLPLAAAHGLPVFGIAQGSDAHQYLDMPLRRRQILRAGKAASGIITRSQDLANRLELAGLPAASLRTVYNGVDTDRFRPGDRLETRPDLGLPPELPVVLYVGNLLPIKNPALLLEAFARLSRDTQLVYVGEGALAQPLRSRAESLGLADRVHLVGPQPAAQVAAYMQAANVLVVPSRNEGIPNVIREAFACGLPVVATDVGGIREVVAHDWLGTLVPSEDTDSMAKAIRHWLENGADARRIRAHAEGFSWQRTVTDCIDFIQSRLDS